MCVGSEFQVNGAETELFL